MASLSQLQADLVKYTAARDKILAGGQVVEVNGTTFTRGSLAAIETSIRDLELRIGLAGNSGRLPMAGVVFGVRR
jgi:hypothetical protein